MLPSAKTFLSVLGDQKRGTLFVNSWLSSNICWDIFIPKNFPWIILFDQESMKSCPTECHWLGEVGRDHQTLPLRLNFSSIVILLRSFDAGRTKKPRWVLNAVDEEQSFLIEGQICKVKVLHSSRPLRVSFAQAANNVHLQKPELVKICNPSCSI